MSNIAEIFPGFETTIKKLLTLYDKQRVKGYSKPEAILKIKNSLKGFIKRTDIKERKFIIAELSKTFEARVKSMRSINSNGR